MGSQIVKLLLEILTEKVATKVSKVCNNLTSSPLVGQSGRFTFTAMALTPPVAYTGDSEAPAAQTLRLTQNASPVRDRPGL